MNNSKPIFISYSRIDKNIVFPFVKRIEQALNTTCWIDFEGIESGSQFEEVIVNAIDESEVVLFMLSDSSISSKWTKREVLYAEDEGKRVVPIVVDKKGLRKWFKFHFGNVDYIDINDKGQCDKLLNNLASWIGVERKDDKDFRTNTNSFFHIKSKTSADNMEETPSKDIHIKYRHLSNDALNALYNYSNDLDACLEIGLRYLFGIKDKSQSENMAIYYFNKAGMTFDEAIKLIKRSNPEMSLLSNETLLSLCKNGDKQACIEMGLRYFIGLKGKYKSITMAKYYWGKCGISYADILNDSI